MKPSDLMRTTHDLLEVDGGRPRQKSLRRALSTAYYALFHCLARSSANALVGKADTKGRAWNRVYRALEHDAARNACSNRAIMKEFPADIRAFADEFVEMQKMRHRADYSPMETFNKSGVEQEIAKARLVIEDYEKAELKHRCEFATFVLFRHRP